MSHAILVGTHHKSGTRWMRALFKDVAASCGLGYLEVAEVSPDLVERSGAATVFFHHHSAFPDRLLARDFRGLHMIRDPRDMVISAAHYHAWSDERWLHEPRDVFAGKTYHQAINDGANGDILLFEMRNATRESIRDMTAWDYADTRFVNAKYEELIDDDRLLRFRALFTTLGFAGEHLDRALEAAWRNSLFSGRASPDPGHVRNGRPRQWATEFRRRHGEAFLDLFGDVLIVLGYERDHGWLDGLPP